jgi:N-acyl-D-aspartate/D-glutamate deacylase
MSKEVKPREWYLNFGTSLGVDVRTPNQFNQAKLPRDKDYQEAAIHVIEYTPEVKRAVELRTELVEQLQTVLDSYRVSVSPEESFIKKALITDTKNLINRAKGQA